MVRNFQVHLPVENPAVVRLETRGGKARLVATGDWTMPEVPRLDSELRRLDYGDAREADIDGGGIKALDSAGAWLLLRSKREMEDGGVRVASFAMPPRYAPLLETMEREHKSPPVTHDREGGLMGLLLRTGQGTVQALRQGYDLVGFLGRITVETWEAILSPRRELPWPAFVHQIEETGVTALPIVGMLAFLLGVVLAYQGADQLRRFGAEIYTIDFLGVGFLRELGGLVTAIIIAGRSGSAFTAQIGTMRVNEETDAMQTIGLNIAEVLVLPRVLGLVIALPLLTFYADVVGIVGGMVMTYFDLGITIPAFMRELQGAINFNTLMVGLIKAPVFAFVIALVGCFEGMRVERNADSVGKLTTRSVVESIFLIIALDAMFSIVFSVLKI
ncbi:MAG TPA: MlaE family lipid ABC transporter permease subunit [Rhizomicrobium sp.]|nr:MlaE family lipid ABC transporter permease subunit [Rhizomicrobium sp.]